MCVVSDLNIDGRIEPWYVATDSKNIFAGPKDSYTVNLGLSSIQEIVIDEVTARPD